MNMKPFVDKSIPKISRVQPGSAPGIHIPPSWEVAESTVTPEEIYLDRRKFLAGLGKVGLAAFIGCTLPGWMELPRAWGQVAPDRRSAGAGQGPELNGSNPVPTAESLTSRYNNFYEFTMDKSWVHVLAQALRTEDWTIRVEGLVKKPHLLNVESLLRRMPQEERIYRLRCVETWSATIPWMGFPLRDLVNLLDPLPSARFVRFKTFLNPNWAPGQKDRFWEPWPYVEGLRLDEALNDLAFIAVGMYGHPLHPQNGAPIRLVVPWKYGFKSIKSIVAIEFTRQAPTTFWQSMSPLEYDFWANVNPSVPYARWHQGMERVLGTGDTVATQPFNGYAGQVAGLYTP